MSSHCPNPTRFRRHTQKKWSSPWTPDVLLAAREKLSEGIRGKGHCVWCILIFPLLSLSVSSLLMSLRLSSTRNVRMITWRHLTVTRTRRPSWAVCVAVRFQNRSSPQGTRCTCDSSPTPQCSGKAFRPLTLLVTTMSFLCLMFWCIIICMYSTWIRCEQFSFHAYSLIEPSSVSIQHYMLIRGPEMLPFLIWLVAKLCPFWLLFLITVNRKRKDIC